MIFIKYYYSCSSVRVGPHGTWSSSWPYPEPVSSSRRVLIFGNSSDDLRLLFSSVPRICHAVHEEGCLFYCSDGRFLILLFQVKSLKDVAVLQLAKPTEAKVKNRRMT